MGLQEVAERALGRSQSLASLLTAGWISISPTVR